MASLVSYEGEGRFARLRMDDGKVNVMSAPMLRALHDAFDRAEREGAIPILEGRPGAFSAGFDLKVFASGDAGAIHEMMHLGATLAERLLSFPLPVVSLCTGHAYPMGCFLLLASDARIGADGPYRLGLNEVTINIAVPSFAVELARQRLTPAAFQRTALLGMMFAPREAAAAGILDEVVAPDAMEAALARLKDSLAGIDLDAHALTKRRVRGRAIDAVRDAIEAEIRPEAYAGRLAKQAAAPGAR